MMARRLGLLAVTLLALVAPAKAQEDQITDGEIEAAIDIDLDGLEVVEEIVDDGGFGRDSDPEDDIDPADIAATLEIDSRLRGAALTRQPRRVLDLVTSRDPKERASAARSIGTERNLLGIGALVAALKDRDPSVRRAAATSLGRIGSFEALGALRAAHLVETDPPTSRAIDKALGAVEDRVFAGRGGGEPITLVCHSCGKKFCLLRRTQTGYCPYDGTVWTLRK